MRLVKGAYWDAEVKEAQVLGADAYPVWTDKRRTDVSYLACAAYLLDNLDKLPNAAFATHNARTAADVLAMAPSIDDFANAGCEFQARSVITLVLIRPRSRGERRFLRTFPGVSLRAPLAFNPRPRRLSTPTDAYELYPDIALYGMALSGTTRGTPTRSRRS